MPRFSKPTALVCAATAGTLVLGSIAAPEAFSQHDTKQAGISGLRAALTGKETVQAATKQTRLTVQAVNTPEPAPQVEVREPEVQADEPEAPRSAGSAAFRSSSESSSGSSSSSAGTRTPKKPPAKRASAPVVTSQGLTIQNRGDVLGPYAAHVGFRSGDLGAMAPIGDGRFAMIFGDSFRGDRIGTGEWMSPVGVAAKVDSTGAIEITGPLNRGSQVEQMVAYQRYNDPDLTLIPSDILNIGGTLYMQGMWNYGLGNVRSSEIWRSYDSGQTWRSLGVTPTEYMSGMGDLISWEEGGDGYIYVVSSSFTRSNPVYLARFLETDMGDRQKWELYDPSTGEWGQEGSPILDAGVKAGEMCLRRIDGKWVLVMFNEATLAVEVRISDTLAQNWDSVPVAVVAKHGSWRNPQEPLNWSQPYGGYIVPGSTLANMGIVVSQWNTENHSRYMATQFNVEGLDRFFGVASSGTDNPLLPIVDHTAPLPDPDPEQPSQPQGSSDAEVTLAVLSVLGLVAGLVAVNWQTLRPLLPPQVRSVLPF
ncbi:DUF4185 domain-containing protein [Corynebacterium sp. TA-R-1]|uniref:DUF4185 domain-containing protein n=1 Tax=Corynebacterium stercoris TaxID=2943490 RepID=A0ABT1G086_9CORY|nr:DUF4185 domain-containing protein [Corynebacterium stercoris]MCP1387421.1 DUF4185 domain-containing protein [Corynebacterium stercoris]